ncbi:MAG: sulfotransferase [Bacteroidales bacterium]|nr:sulfotransferase [Bacteroidales bacterium]
MTNNQKIPFFFIIGRPRSGTTLLRTMFDAHPNVCIPFECPMIINLHLKFKTVKKWTKEKKLSFYNSLFTQWKFDSFRVNNDKLKTELLQLPEDCEFEDLIRKVYSNFNSVYEKEEILLFGDKNPEYSLNSFYINRLIKIFPNAKFIHLIRDYRDNFVSYKNVDFEAPVAPLIAYRWKNSVLSVEKIAKIYPQQFIIQRFEDLIAEPETNLQKLCAFLNLEFSTKMLDYKNKKQEFIETFPKEILEKYHSSTMGELDKSKINAWQNKMTESEIKKSDYISGKTGEKFGYIRKYNKASISVILKSLPWIIYGKLWMLLKWVIDHLPFKWRTAIIARGPVLAWVYNKIFR